MRTSWERPESASQVRPLKARLGCPLDFILKRPRDDQIKSLVDVLGMLEEDVLGKPWGPIFANW